MSLRKLKEIFKNQGTSTGQPQSFGDKFQQGINDKSRFLPIYNSFTNSNILFNITKTNSENAFPSSYTPINRIIGGEFINRDVLGQHGWPDLYTANHQSKPVNIGEPKSSNPFQSRGGASLNIKNNPASTISALERKSAIGKIGSLLGGLGLDATEDLLDGREPYIVSRIPREQGDTRSGRFFNVANRNLPLFRATNDTLRVAKYLTSPQGIANALLKNADLVIPQTVVRKDNELIRVPQRFNAGYNPLNTLVAVSPIARLLGQTPNVLLQSGYTGEYKTTDVQISTLGYRPEYDINSTFTTGIPADEEENSDSGNFFSNLFDNTVTKTSTGDKMTLAKMIQGNVLDSLGGNTTGINDQNNKLTFDVEKKEEGMPFYFKDLRDNKYIFFRAYIDGLNETISPSWAESNYIGRSEPVYVYERASRSISFNLTLFAQTSSELDKIYLKMNKLTSLCYPQYANDEFLSSTLSTDSTVVSKTRMKPPLMKLRLGDLYGKPKTNNNSDGGLIGFLESLSYTIPDESTYETENGKKVPKYIQASITYKVIHGEVPNIDTQFYGYKGA